MGSFDTSILQLRPSPMRANQAGGAGGLMAGSQGHEAVFGPR